MFDIIVVRILDICLLIDHSFSYEVIRIDISENSQGAECVIDFKFSLTMGIVYYVGICWHYASLVFGCF